MTRLSCQMGILLIAGLAFGVFAQPADTTGRVVSLQGERARIAINRIGGLPVLFRTCSGVCDSDGSKQINLMSEGSSGGRLQWKMPGNPDALRRLQLLEYSAVVEETDEGSTVPLIAEREFDGRLLHHDYRLSRNGHVLEMDLDLPAGVELQWVTGADFVPEPLPGFGCRDYCWAAT